MADDNLTTKEIRQEAQSIAKEARGVSAKVGENAAEKGQEDVAKASQKNTEKLGQQVKELGGNIEPIDSQVNAKDITSDQSEGVGYTDPVSSQQGYMGSMTEQVDKHRQRLEERLASRRQQIKTEKEDLEKEQQSYLDEKDKLSKPFREDLQKKQREEKYINKNFEKRQDLVDEMDSLLQEGNELITQQKETTGLKSVRNPRVQKTMDEVSARAGVIESVLSARKGQIQMAQNQIDRSIGAIESDRKDRKAYYDTLIKMNENDILDLDKENEQLAKEQRDLIKGDLEMAEKTSQKIKNLMMDPSTAELMGQANVKLTDSPKEVSEKISDAQYNQEVNKIHNKMRGEGAEPIADPSQVPDSELVTRTDSRGKTHYYRKETSDQLGAQTMNVLQGKSMDDLTSSTRETVENELWEAGLSPYKNKPTDEFREVMEGILQKSPSQDKLQELWNKYQQRMTGEGSSGEDTAGDYFSDSQIAKGADNADMDISEFKDLSQDEANTYIYGEKSEEEESGRQVSP